MGVDSFAAVVTDPDTGAVIESAERMAHLLEEIELADRVVVCEVGDWELFLEMVSAGVGIGFAPVGLQYPVLTAPDSVLRLIAVAGVHL